MISYPDWSDLGLGSLSEQTRFSWDAQLMLLERYHYYFDGEVLKEQVQTEVPNDQETPLLFPAGLNLVKLLCLAQADSAFGEWDEQPVQFAVRKDQQVESADVAAIDLASAILEASNGGPMLWEHELERNVFGGGAFKISPKLSEYPHVRWDRIPRESFFPIWDPDNPDELLEAYVVVWMTAEQAYAKYRYQAKTELIQRLEHWTRFKYENFLDRKPMPTYSGVNPWGVVPFVYTPRYRLTSWWGDSLTADVVPVQDELNMRIGDIGDAINYNAHPVRYGINLPREFNAKNYPLGANSFWNLGRSIGSNPPPQVGIMEAKAAVQPGTFDYMKFIYNWGRTSAFAPPIAFGEDDGGGQRSGVTLEIRMWPLLKATRRGRSYLAGSLLRALKISAAILKQKRFGDVPARALESLLSGRIVPRFFNILPRDQQVAVDEVVKLLSTTPKSISLETAQTVLGRGTGEVKRIREMLADEELWTTPADRQQMEMEQQALEAKSKPKGKPVD